MELVSSSILIMHSLYQLLLHVKRTKSSIDLRKKSDKSKKGRSRTGTFASSSTSMYVQCRPPPCLSLTVASIGRDNIVPTSSPWDLLPVELQIKIFAHCGVGDLLPLKLVCRSFYQVLSLNEQSVAQQYLRERRHGTLPSPIHNERKYTRNPEDDVVLLSDLFPPSKSAKGGHLYTFRYVHSLRRRQRLCSRLSYYIADRVMDRFVENESLFMKHSFPSKNERYAFFQRGIASLWFSLTPLM